MDFTYYLQQLNKIKDRASERSYYDALINLIDNPSLGIKATSEEKRDKAVVQAGIPDFTVRKGDSVIGYIEAKKLGENLTKIAETEQLKKYLGSSIGYNLILTNFLDFHWYQYGKLELIASLGTFKNNNIINNNDQVKVVQLIENFLDYKSKEITNYLDLAQQMAAYTKSIKLAIEEGLNIEDNTGELTQLKLGFQGLLLPDLDNNSFADMYAQTIAYGLFTARIGHAQNPQNTDFSRQTASLYIGNKIPFLKGLFSTVIETDIVSNINWTIDNLVKLLAEADIVNILENFGQKTKKEDPIVHFYETFLTAYEANLRKSRGVYYTPEPVVSFMVKAVNDILDRDFDLQDGLAHRNVTILDPATGTGTFLYQVIKQIYLDFEQYQLKNWHQFLRKRKVLQRLYGFELLMTPYTIAHLKIQILLEDLGYRFEETERLNIFLTNALDKGIKKSEILFRQYIAEEGNLAATIKQKTPIHVVIGNPPYSGHSENKNEWIEGLVRDYYEVDGIPLDEKNPKWLQDDYVKFIRFGQDQIDQTKGGILALITNHGYLDNPTFRGMRQHLLKSFSRLFIINLHGNIKKKEVAPDGSKDQNVFDIQQGVSILIAVKDLVNQEQFFFNPDKEIPEKGVYYYDLWGSRENKYKLLHELDIHNITWEQVNPVSPFYLFVPQNAELQEEYNQYWKITDIMPVNVLGFQTHRDDFAIDFDRDELYKRIKEMRNARISDNKFYEKYQIKDNRDWQLPKARQAIKNDRQWENKLINCLYRPFDWRSCYFSTVAMDYPRRELINHVMGKENLCLLTSRQQATVGYRHCWVSDKLPESCVVSTTSREGNQVFPLYIYPDTENGQNNLIQEKQANFAPGFLTAITEKLGYTPTAENIFYYIYAILHSPNYRYRYAPFLKIDFPHIPLTSNTQIFNQLVEQGETLVNLHLLKILPDILLTQSATLATANLPLFNGEERGSIHYQGDGENEVTQVIYNSSQQRVTINKDCYFTGISQDVWEFKIGGYQVLDKWLKDRKKANRKLSIEDIIHYQKIVVALAETIKIMQEIDTIIADFPIL